MIMTLKRCFFPGILASFVSLTACGSNTPADTSKTGVKGGDAGNMGGGGAAGADPACPNIVADADCDKTQRPFVFVHGTYGSGDNFAHVASLLGSNGFCQDRIVAVEYNSLGDKPGANCDSATPAPQGCGNIDAVINKVLADNPDFTQVDLAGHSQGTAHCKTYLADATHAAKVAHYINFSGVGAVPNDVDTLSVSSLHDLGNTTNHATGTHVTEFTMTDEDHFACAASTRSFVRVFNYLRGADPKYQEVQCGDTVTIEGIAETFADNTPATGKLEIREMSDTPRGEGTQVTVANPDAHGHFGPVQVKRNVPYEFKGFDAAGKLIGYQYFTPFKRSNRLVRLLIPASATDGSPVGATVAQLSTDHIVSGPNHVAVVARWAGGAFRQDLGASMTVDGNAVLTSGNAGADAFSANGLGGGVVGFFMNDANLNGQTDLGLYYSGPFIAFTDVFIGTATPKFAEFSFTPGSEDPAVTDQKVKISNFPSSDAQILVMFQ